MVSGQGFKGVYSITAVDECQEKHKESWKRSIEVHMNVIPEAKGARLGRSQQVSNGPGHFDKDLQSSPP